MNGPPSLRQQATTDRLRGFSTFRIAVMAAFACISLAMGLLFSILVPPWQAPDEPRHLEYAIRLSDKGWLLHPDDLSRELQAEILASMRDFDYWRLIGREQPDPLPATFVEDSFLIRSGARFADESPLYALVPALVFRILPGDDLLLHLYVMRWFSVLLSVATVVAACAMAIRLFPEDRFMMLAIPAFVAFLPMFTFIGASANNGVLATLVVSLLVWQVVRALHTGLTRRCGAVMCGLVVLSILSKRTALFAAPFVLASFLVYLAYRRISLGMGHKCILGASVTLLALLVAVLLSWRGNEAAYWLKMPDRQGDNRSDACARSAQHALYLNNGRMIQSIPFNTVRALRGRTVTLEAWMISPEGERRGSLVVRDDKGRSATDFLSRETWTGHSVIHTVSPGARSMRVVLSAAADASGQAKYICYDDLSLTASKSTARNLLHNGSGEVAALRGRALASEITRYVSARQLLDPRSYDLASLQRYLLYVMLTFVGFWANFGWLTLPLHVAWYALLAVMTLASGVGLLFWIADLMGRRRKNREWVPGLRDCTLALFLVGFLLIALQTFLPMMGSQWQPQGRYLFPALTICATLFAFGIRRLLPRVDWRLLSAGYLACFLTLDAVCLFCYILPHYYG